MRPVRGKTTQVLPEMVNGDEEDEEDEEDDERDEEFAAEKPQKSQKPAKKPNVEDSGDHGDSEYSEVDGTDEEDPAAPEKPIGKQAKKGKAKFKKPGKETPTAEKATGTGRKRSATAGANYRKLNIRTQGGMKGRSGGGKFNRRRR